MLRSAPAIAFLSAALTAQQITTTSYVQDSPRGMFGNIAPFGCLTTGLAAEGRSQILIPAQYLPGPNSFLVGMAASSANSFGASQTITYASLKITVSPTTATSLSATFAANLPSPTVVLNATNLSIPWVANDWTPITFTTGYVHDGTRGLVIDIQKVAIPGDLGSKTVANANRTDVPRMINAFGNPGSGANNATTATVTTNPPLSMQLRWTGPFSLIVPTLKLRSDVAGTHGNQFAISGSVAVTVQGAPGSVFITTLGVFVNPPLPLPPIIGLYRVTGITLNAGGLSPAGLNTLTLPIPNDPSLVGAAVAFQSLTAETLVAPFRFTNATDCVINN